MKYLCSFFLLICSFLYLGAQEDAGNGMLLNYRTKVFKTRNRLHPDEAYKMLKANKWVQLKGRASHGLTQDFFWISFNISDLKDKDKSYILELNSPHIDSAALYWIKEGEAVLIAEIGDKIPFSKRPVIHPKLLFPIPEDDKKGDYLLKIDKQGGSANFPLYLWDKESFEYHNTKEMLLWYVFMGSLVFFTLLSILTAFLLKNKLFRYYSFFIFIILCYNFITSGFSFAFIYPDNIWLNDLLRFLILPLFGISYLLFTKHYFEIYRAFPFMELFVKILHLIFIILICIGLIFNDVLLSYAIPVVSVLYVTLIAAAGWSIGLIFQVWHRLRNRSLFFLFAFSGNILVLIFNVLTEFGLLEKSLFRFNPIFIANIQEIVVMTIGMYFYFKRINEERAYLKKEKNQLKNSEIQFKEQIRQFFSQADNQQTFLSHKEAWVPTYPYRLKDKTLINLSEVLFAEAMDHYLVFHFIDKKVMDRKSIKEFITSISENNFIQIHKSYIVNKVFISTIEGNKITMVNGQTLPLSRTYKSKIIG